jgi:Zn finger protein HypA/HybF involved in hydrogenase expression
MPPTLITIGEGTGTMICSDCGRSFRLENGHHSAPWCPKCLLDHVGLCRRCRRVFDRSNQAEVLCSGCAPRPTARTADHCRLEVVLLHVELVALIFLAATAWAGSEVVR